MGMFLSGVSQSNILKAARDVGLSLTEEQVREIAEIEKTCLDERGRVSFGGSAAAQLLREFAASPNLAGCEQSSLMELTEAFYDIREDLPASITDIEILEELRRAFDGEAAGDVGLAVSRACESLSAQRTGSSYEIADDDGNVYRWDPDEWHDDVYADGWYGERWENADE